MPGFERSRSTAGGNLKGPGPSSRADAVLPVPDAQRVRLVYGGSTVIPSQSSAAQSGFECGQASPRFLLCLHGEQSPIAGHALQRTTPDVAKLYGRPCDKILYRARNNDFVRRRLPSHSRSRVNRDATYVVANHFTLSSVQSRANLHPQPSNCLGRRRCATNCPGRTVKRGEHTVARGGDLPSAKSRKLSAHRRIVPIEKLAPATVSKLGRALRRPDNIHEENRGEHTVRFRGLSHARQEFLDLGDQTVGVLGKEQMVPSRQLDISRTLYVLGQISAVLRPGEGVARPMQDEGRHANRAEDAPGVSLERRSQKGDRSSGAGSQSLIAPPPIAHHLVVRLTGDQSFEGHALAPLPIDELEQSFGLVARQSERIILSPRQPSVRVQQDQSDRTMRMTRREQQVQGARLGGADERRTSAAGRVEHRADIVHPLLQRGKLIERNRIRKPRAALVQQNQSAE